MTDNQTLMQLHESLFISSDEVEAQVLGWGILKQLSENIISPMNFRIGCAFILPKSRQPEHNHPKENEFLYIISGKGIYYIKGIGYSYQMGNFVYIPEGLCHYSQNDSWEPINYITIKKYTPKNNLIQTNEQFIFDISSEVIKIKEWGYYFDINEQLNNSVDVPLRMYYIFPRKMSMSNRSIKCYELIYVISGKGIFNINNKNIIASQGDLIYIPKDHPYLIDNTTSIPLNLLSVTMPANNNIK